MERVRIIVVALIISFLSNCMFLISEQISSASGGIIIVGEDYEYISIKDALDASKNGDTILIDGGSYDEDITIRKKVSLIGNGSSIPVLRSITVRSSNVNLENIRTYGFGSGIVIENPSH